MDCFLKLSHSHCSALDKVVDPESDLVAIISDNFEPRVIIVNFGVSVRVQLIFFVLVIFNSDRGIGSFGSWIWALRSKARTCVGRMVFPESKFPTLWK